MPAPPRPTAWIPWALGLVAIGALSFWLWTSWVRETEAELSRVKERERALAAAQAREEAASARAYEALIRATIRHQEDRPEVQDQPKLSAKRLLKPAKVIKREKPQTATELNCRRLRDAYSPEELAAMPTYQEVCPK